ncbi:hypothetical protein ACIQU6_31650 [Streptomyces sp. NPDC090442]|uniref:hypothetical protein n=1 Tax=Streptomyces sp. NPDC090442 TaxID=3365962 RepID=UPI0037F90161
MKLLSLFAPFRRPKNVVHPLRTHCTLQAVCDRRVDTKMRTLYTRAFTNTNTPLDSVHTIKPDGSVHVRLQMTLTAGGPGAAALERLVVQLSREPHIRALRWHLQTDGGSTSQSRARALERPPATEADHRPSQVTSRHRPLAQLRPHAGGNVVPFQRKRRGSRLLDRQPDKPMREDGRFMGLTGRGTGLTLLTSASCRPAAAGPSTEPRDRAQ